MTQFFTSDHHFEHANILRHCAQTRPFASVGAMNRAYVERWNDTVRPKDTVWYLGDFSMRGDVVGAIAPRLHGVKHLIAGNHDKCFGLGPQQVDLYLRAGFATVQRQHILMLQGQRLALCHFPYRVPPSARSSNPDIAARQEKQARFSLEAGAGDEVALVHGHVHQYWRARVGAAARPELNVAVDAWDGVPASEDQLLALLSESLARPQREQMDWRGEWGPLHDDASAAQAAGDAAG